MRWNTNYYDYRMEENDFVAIWLEETGNPAIERLSQLNLAVAAKTAAAIANNELSEQDLAIALDVNPDEIKRWLSGRHTFSMTIITEIAAKLEVLPE